MNPLNATKRHYAKAIVCGLLVTPLLGATASADEDAAAPFTMTVLTDEAYGAHVKSGKYEHAIAKLKQMDGRAINRFAEQNNLCVAYAKTTDLTNAVAACEAAIAEVKERETRASNRPKYSQVARAYRSDLAIALSNHGVLLAVQGAIDEARATFEAAMELKAGASRIASRNLDSLGKKNSSG
jgi:tetratricopeptide (TPR) repeat protein